LNNPKALNALTEAMGIEFNKVLKTIDYSKVNALVVTGEDRKSHNEFQFDCEAVIIPLVSGTGHGHASIKS
jgi:hypothetical protein